MSQTELSAVTGISQGHISNLARGLRSAEDRTQALSLREHAGIELEWWDEAPVEEEKGAA